MCVCVFVCVCVCALVTIKRAGRDSSVGIATGCELEGPGIESRYGRDFLHHSRRPGTHPASYTMGTLSFPGVNRPRRGVDYPPHSSAEVKKRVELYLYSPSGPSWPVLRLILPLYLYLYHEMQRNFIIFFSSSI